MHRWLRRACGVSTTAAVRPIASLTAALDMILHWRPLRHQRCALRGTAFNIAAFGLFLIQTPHQAIDRQTDQCGQKKCEDDPESQFVVDIACVGRSVRWSLCY